MSAYLSYSSKYSYIEGCILFIPSTMTMTAISSLGIYTDLNYFKFLYIPLRVSSKVVLFSLYIVMQINIRNNRLPLGKLLFKTTLCLVFYIVLWEIEPNNPSSTISKFLYGNWKKNKNNSLY